MAELTELIRISKPVKTDLEDIKEKEKHSSLDSVIRNTLEKNGRLEAEIKLLKNELVEIQDDKNSYQMDLNMTILEKEQLQNKLDDITRCLKGDEPQTEELQKLKEMWCTEAIAEYLKTYSYNE